MADRLQRRIQNRNEWMRQHATFAIDNLPDNIRLGCVDFVRLSSTQSFERVRNEAASMSKEEQLKIVEKLSRVYSDVH